MLHLSKLEATAIPKAVVDIHLEQYVFQCRHCTVLS